MRLAIDEQASGRTQAIPKAAEPGPRAPAWAPLPASRPCDRRCRAAALGGLPAARSPLCLVLPEPFPSFLSELRCFGLGSEERLSFQLKEVQLLLKSLMLRSGRRIPFFAQMGMG